MTTASDWWAGARPRTLPAAVVPVVVGWAVAYRAAHGEGRAAGIYDVEAIDVGVTWWRVVAALAVSLLLQIGVNYANDYSDGVRGTDDVRVGPMRLVASGRASPGAVKRAALAVFGLAALVGLALAATTSWWLIVVGLAAILAAWGYTGGPRPYGYLGLGEVFVFTFFGLVATVGTTYVAIGHVPDVAWPAAVGVGLLACALLVVNNLRDIPTDTAAGKRTLAVRLGDARTRWFYVVLVVGAAACAVICAGWRPWAALGVVALAVAIQPVKAVLGGAKGPALIPVLGGTGKVQLAYGSLLAIGLLIG
ncbi:MAG TPA: 1,4-dihydroxy-2-naphthoate polyprenyltransferase [Ilumatobacter sp.]|nr:1,4-dihydroxy-2-naphthoate polyprenyltransferase [Ilumatobacter sp.]